MQRIDKFIVSQGNFSRKDVKKLIKEQKILVNGKVVLKPEEKVDENCDKIVVCGKKISYKKYIYLMLNKPQGIVSATSDRDTKTVVDLVPSELMRKDLFPAGRLDKDTEGFVLLTDDGKFAHDILSPKKHVVKQYIVHVNGLITEEMVIGFKNGVNLKNMETCKPSRLEILSSSQEKSVTRVYLREGMYHQIKRMFASFGLKVIYLKRIKIGGLCLDESLELGQMRELNDKEVELIKIGDNNFKL